MIKDRLKLLPHKPGCYLMKDKNNKVIYVGKAISLKNRVNSYFVGAHDFKTTKLVSNIKDFDFIVTKNEKEALVLEYNLIKKYNPYYNIVFKDDKSYPYIVLHDSKEPYLSVIRKKKNSKLKGRLFGPYPDVGPARNTVSILNKVYPTRKCEKLAKKECLYYHIGECLGYCINDVDKSKCESIKKEIISFLNGNTSPILKNLKKEMDVESEKLNFERCNEIKSLIEDININSIKQSVEITDKTSIDLFNYYSSDGFISIVGLFIRNGLLINTFKFFDYLVGDEQNYVTNCIYQYYSMNEKPKHLYVPKDLLVYLNKSLDFEVSSVSKGKIRSLLKNTYENAVEYYKQNRLTLVKDDEYKKYLGNEFNEKISFIPKRIELFDNSHTAGKETVGAMVVYENFAKNKNEYRLFKITDGADDIKSMKEIIYRRYFRVLKDNLTAPDMIIVDGGYNQIVVAKDIINSLGLDIKVYGLGKDDKHSTSYLMDSSGNKVQLDKDSTIFKFLTLMQDEVHRFAISYHRKRRSKATYTSKLDNIKGLGPTYRNRLLKKYKTISNIEKLSIKELSEILPKNVAIKLYNKLKEK